MRRIALWLVCTVAVLVLLFTYRTSTSGPGGPGIPAAAARAGGTQPPGVVGGAGSGAAGTGEVTVNGPVVQTRWGPVQVQVRLSGGKIVDVVALRVPDGNFRDQEINSYAVPMLRQEALDAQSARIDMVGGATVTSGGYIQSLQAALDAAHVTG
jgi:hypothetical protein